MRRMALSLAVLAAVGLAANAALAGSSSPSVSLHVGTTMVGHQGQHGTSLGYRSYRYGRPQGPRYYRYGHGPVIVRPMVPRRPPAIYAVPGYPPVHAPVYRRYYNSPRGSLHYQGRGFGISIGF